MRIARIAVGGRTQVEPVDLLDAVRTLSPKGKLSVATRPPGMGPTKLLEWARVELVEAESAQANDVGRKAFAAAVLARCAVECLVDWYLKSWFLDATLRPHAGLEEKLEALDAENALALGGSLFRDVLFEPRNRAVHSYEPVDLRSARHAVQLATLAVSNCQRMKDPASSTVFYGELTLAEGAEAAQLAGLRRRQSRPRRSASAARTRQAHRDADKTEYFYLGGAGPRGTHSVFLSRGGPVPQVAILESLGDGAVDVRYSKISDFEPELLRELAGCLEQCTPTLLDIGRFSVASIIDYLETLVNERAT